jgi:Ca2+/H+ antiporter
MSSLFKAIRSKPLSLLLVFVPLALIAEYMHWDPLAVFIIAAIGVIPLAAYIGEARKRWRSTPARVWVRCSTPRWATPRN